MFEFFIIQVVENRRTICSSIYSPLKDSLEPSNKCFIRPLSSPPLIFPSCNLSFPNICSKYRENLHQHPTRPHVVTRNPARCLVTSKFTPATSKSENPPQCDMEMRKSTPGTKFTLVSDDGVTKPGEQTLALR